MIINISFFVFLIFCVAVYWIIPSQKVRTLFISMVSLFFVAYYDKGAAILIILLTVYAYFFAILISSKDKKDLYHRIGIIGLILILIIFKYLGLLTQTFNNLAVFLGELPKINFEKVLLPLGISYITFKLISYLTDVFWGVTEKGNFFDLLCYTSMFTIYTAGPIERFERFGPQITVKNKFQSEYVEKAIERIIYGLFKKLVIADWIGYFIFTIWENQTNHSIGIRMLALLGYSVQIYTDFAGYSDIAIGSSQLFGITIMENFDKPYFQKNISEFWRHWHISLSSWIRDYIFFPLSGYSKNKIWSLLFVPVIAMALCGLWHGAEWHFMIWGIWHGAGISIYQIWSYYRRKKKNREVTQNKLLDAVKIVFTFVFVTIGWLWFI